MLSLGIKALLVKLFYKIADRQSTSSAHGQCNAHAIKWWTGISYGNLWQSLRILLKRYPYEMQLVQGLKKSIDLTKCQDFVNGVLVQMEDYLDWLLNASWTEKAHFSLNGRVNTQNYHPWSRENPCSIVEKPLLDV